MFAAWQVQQEAHIKHATQLEQQLMEGAYNKVLSAKSTVPDQSYLYFMDKLISTVRYRFLIIVAVHVYLDPALLGTACLIIC